jgi:hypothetical protein
MPELAPEPDSTGGENQKKKVAFMLITVWVIVFFKYYFCWITKAKKEKESVSLMSFLTSDNVPPPTCYVGVSGTGFSYSLVVGRLRQRYWKWSWFLCLSVLAGCVLSWWFGDGFKIGLISIVWSCSICEAFVVLLRVLLVTAISSGF